MIPVPYDRPMTEDERRGFSMACACIARMGRLLAAEPSVAGPMTDVMRDARAQGRMLIAVSTAFDRQLGAAALARPRPR